MQVFRIFTLFFCLLISIPRTFATPSDAIGIDNSFYQNASNIVWQHNLTSEQMQLLLNFFQLAYARAQIARLSYQHIAVVSVALVQMKAEQSDPTNKPAIDWKKVYTAVTTLKQFAGYNALIMQSLAQIGAILAQPENQPVMLIIQQVSDQVANHIDEQAQKQSNSITPLYEKMHEALNNVASITQIATNGFEALNKGTLPLLYEGRSKALSDLEIAQQFMQSIDPHLSHLTETTQPLIAIIDTVQKAGIAIFNLYFQVMYDGMKKRNIEEHYFDTVLPAHIIELINQQ